jgi:O-antigen/teichoic acid export membrane protein
LSKEKVRLARSAIYLTLQGLSSSILGIIYFAFIARLLLEISDLGKIVSISMFSDLLVTFTTLSISSAVTKYFSESIGKEDEKGAHGVIINGLKFLLLSAISSSAICIIFASQISLIFLKDSKDFFYFWLLSINIFLVILSQLFTSIIYAAQMFREYFITYIISNFIKTFTSIILLEMKFGIIGVLTAWIAGSSSLFLVSLIFSKNLLKIGKNKGEFSLKTMLKYSVPIYGSSIISYFQSTIDKYVILLLTNQEILGLYAPAVTAMAYVAGFSGYITSAIFPKMSELFGKKDLDTMLKGLKEVSRYASIIYVPLAFGLAAVSIPTIDLFAGSRYVGGGPVLMILALTSIILPISNTLGVYFASIGNTKVFFISSLFSLIMGSTFSLILVPVLSIIGAALARGFSTFFGFIIFLFCLENKKIIDWKNFLKVSIISLIMAIVVYSLTLIIYSKYLLPIYILIGGIIYITLIIILKVINKSDIELMIDILPDNIKNKVKIIIYKFFPLSN